LLTCTTVRHVQQRWRWGLGLFRQRRSKPQPDTASLRDPRLNDLHLPRYGQSTCLVPPCLQCRFSGKPIGSGLFPLLAVYAWLSGLDQQQPINAALSGTQSRSRAEIDLLSAPCGGGFFCAFLTRPSCDTGNCLLVGEMLLGLGRRPPHALAATTQPYQHCLCLWFCDRHRIHPEFLATYRNPRLISRTRTAE
jgi:hypothetical protein